MAHQAEMKKDYNVAITYFIQKMRAIESSGLRFNLKSENPAEGGSVWFRLHSGMSAKSYGEKITITLRPTAYGTNVHIHSECGLPTQLMDLGKNKSNCEEIFRYLEQGIAAAPAAAAPAYTAAPAPAPAPAPMAGTSPYPAAQPDISPLEQPAPAPARTHIYCAHCGAQNAITNRFCIQCGNQLIY